MNKTGAAIKPYFLFSFKIPLRYNSFINASIDKSDELVMGLDHDLEWEKDNIMNQADIDGNVHISVAARQYLDEIRDQYPQYICRLTNVYDGSEGEESSNRDSSLVSEYLLSVDDFVAVSESKALEILRNEVTELCNAISILLARHNCNKHIFQPRVEPDWERKVIEKKKILPESQKAHSYIDENGNIVHEVIAGIEVSVSCSSKMFGRMPADELSGFMRAQNPQYQYVMQEYCAALGTEGTRSKYFHLFCIIEFIEREYITLAGADRVLTDIQVEELDRAFKEFLHQREDWNKKTINAASSGIKGCLKKLTTAGRAQKLVNILHAMHIDRIKDGGIEFEVNKEFVQNHINMRNTLFHGNATEKQIEKMVAELMCLDMKVLEYIMGR